MNSLVKKKTVSRDREQTKARIIDALEAVLIRDGFQMLGVNAVAREAGVDKVLIYRYFGGLPGLVREYAEQGNFWPTLEELSEGVPCDPGQTDFAELSAILAVNYLRHLLRRPVTCEILAWELVEAGEAASILEQMREDTARKFMQLLAPIREDGLAAGRDPDASSTFITAAINYLGIRHRKPGIFNGLDLSREEEWERIEAVMRGMITSWIRSQGIRHIQGTSEI